MSPRTTRHPADEPQIPFRRIVWSFSLAVAAVVALVLYYTLGQATVTLEVEPTSTVMETKLTASMQPASGELAATIATAEVSDTKTFPASPSGDLEDKATGTVTIKSTNNAAQTLIATTRLLSPQGVLYRLSETVTVPANGQAQATIIADKGGEGSVIGPTHFTIPGLRAQLQQKIYAESTDPTSRAKKPGNQVTSADLDEARKSMSESLAPQALAKLRDQLPSDKRSLTVVYQTDVTKAESNVAASTKAKEFKYTVTLKVTGVFYDAATLRDQAMAKLQADLTSGRKILTLQEESLAVGIDSIAADQQSAILKVKFMAQVTITDPDTAVKKDDLLGRTPDEVQNYFTGVPGVKHADVTLWPFWVKTVPTIPDHITIKLQ